MAKVKVATRAVIYSFQKHNKINGTLFYCFEYFSFLSKTMDIDFYIEGIDENNLKKIKKIFKQKYQATTYAQIDKIKTISRTSIYSLNLEKTLILDIKTLNKIFDFLTNDVYCFSNEAHSERRYKNGRNVTYYGSYEYQNFDVFNYLKLNFDIFKGVENNNTGNIFLSSPDMEYLKILEKEITQQNENVKVMSKRSSTGRGDIFEEFSNIIYVHTSLDTNNRIIPESFFYKKNLKVINKTDIVDSVNLRMKDIERNGLQNYYLSEDDLMVRAMS